MILFVVLSREERVWVCLREGREGGRNEKEEEEEGEPETRERIGEEDDIDFAA